MNTSRRYSLFGCVKHKLRDGSPKQEKTRKEEDNRREDRPKHADRREAHITGGVPNPQSNGDNHKEYSAYFLHWLEGRQTPHRAKNGHKDKVNALLYARAKGAPHEFKTHKTSRDENAKNPNESKNVQRPGLVGRQKGSLPRQKIKERLGNYQATQHEDMGNTTEEFPASHHYGPLIGKAKLRTRSSV